MVEREAALDRWLRWLLPLSALPLPLRYAAATLAVMLATAVRMALPLVGLPYFVFIPALMFVGFVLGSGAGIYASILSAMVSTYLFVTPANGTMFSAVQLLGAASYALIITGVVVVCAALRRILVSRDQHIAALIQSERQLALSEQRLNLALGATSGMVGIWDWDLKTDKVYADANFARIYNVDPAAAAAGVQIVDFTRHLHPDDVASFEAELARQLAGAGEFSSEYRILQPDGSVRWLLARGGVIRDEDGTPLRLPGASIDITERKQAEFRRLALLELGDRLRDLDDTREMAMAAAEILGKSLGVSRAGYGTVDPVRETIQIENDWNAPGVQSIAGTLHFREYGSYIEDLKRGEVVAIVDAQQDARTVATAPALEAISARSLINMPLKEAGNFVALSFVNNATVRKWNEDEVAFMRSLADRTRVAIERRRAELDLRDLAASLERRVAEQTEELKQREARFRSYFNASPEYLFLFRVEGDAPIIYEDLNLAGETLHQFSRERVLGKTPADLFDSEVSELLDQKARECLRMGRDLRYESSRTFGSGPPVVLNIVVAPIERYDDGSGLVLFCGRDLTDQRRAEEALRQSQKMEAVGQLTGGVAHDFNNLLTGITGSLQLLQTRVRQGRIAEVERYVTVAQGAADRAAALTHRLLAFSRQQALDPRPTQVNQLIIGMEELIRRTVGPGIKLEVVGTAGLWTTLVDPNQLESALLNLCINARDAMPGGGRLTVETGNRWMDERAAAERDLPPGQFISLCVSDTGTGMTPEVIKRAFDPFFTTKPLGMGTGLGLSMIYGFAQQSGGQARIYSEVGRGSMVCIYLPRYFGPDEAAEIPAEPSEAVRAEHGEIVLVVDDEASVRMLVTEVLEELGYVAMEAADGAAALKALQAAPRFDLLITDIGLPGGLDGRELADAARLLRPDLKVLFITGYAENAAIGHGYLEPGMQVMTKPFAIDALAARIKSIIDDG